MEETARQVFFTNDAVVLGILMLILGFIFYTSSLKTGIFSKIYKVVPAILLCYFIPAIFNSLNLVDGEASKLYFVASRYLLPASLVLLTLSIDFKSIMGLGKKALIMFFTATLGIVIGGPLALWVISSFNPAVLQTADGEGIWKGLSTVAGSWIGGGANQTAMKEITGCSDKLFSAMIVVDVFVANIWMGVLLYGAGVSGKLDKWLKADSSSIELLKAKVEKFQAENSRIMSTTDLMVILTIAFVCVGIGHYAADEISPIMSAKIQAMKDGGSTFANYITTIGDKFFWLVVVVTVLGIAMSFTKLSKYEGAGASKVGTVFLYVLVATIGMKMNIGELIANWAVFKYLLMIGFLWMAFHILLILIVAKLIKAPFFFVAIGSQANIGGAASAPVVASAFSPSLAPVGVLLAVLGYAVGTFGALIASSLMSGI